MRKIWVFLLGVLTGSVLTVLFLVAMAKVLDYSGKSNAKDMFGLNLFEQPGEVIDENEFRVFQALSNGAALAEGKGDGTFIYNGLNVLLYNEKGIPYYDEQIVTAPQGKCFRQIGIFKYTSKARDYCTVPVVALMDK